MGNHSPRREREGEHEDKGLVAWEGKGMREGGGEGGGGGRKDVMILERGTRGADIFLHHIQHLNGVKNVLQDLHHVVNLPLVGIAKKATSHLLPCIPSSRQRVMSIAL